MGIAFLFFRLFKRVNLESRIKKEVIVELGSRLSAQDFLNEKIEDVRVDFDFSSSPQVGEYTVQVYLGEEVFDVLLFVVDTTPPKIETKDLSIYIDEDLPNIKSFITHIEELSDYLIREDVIEKKLGVQEIEVVVVDKFGNIGRSWAKLSILEDTEAPVFDGLSPISIPVGESVDLKEGVTAFDKRFGKTPFSYDDSTVHYSVPGTYFISYFAEDPLGNKREVTRTIEIKPREKTYRISSFPVFSQYPNYPNGCESAALYNLLRYYKVNVGIEDIVNALKKGAGPYFKDGTLYGGNPEVEFVGDPRDKHGYGVFQKPIIEVANLYKKGIIDYTGHSFSEVLEIVKQGIPVQVWGSIHNEDTKICVSWIDVSTGKKVDWICNLHSVILIGFTSHSVFVSDSYSGKIEEYDKVQFEKMFDLFGRRAIYYKE